MSGANYKARNRVTSSGKSKGRKFYRARRAARAQAGAVAGYMRSLGDRAVERPAHVHGDVSRGTENFQNVIHRRDVEHTVQVRAVKHLAHEVRRIYQLQLNAVVTRPAMQEDQHAQ